MRCSSVTNHSFKGARSPTSNLLPPHQMENLKFILSAEELCSVKARSKKILEPGTLHTSHQHRTTDDVWHVNIRYAVSRKSCKLWRTGRFPMWMNPRWKRKKLDNQSPGRASRSRPELEENRDPMALVSGNTKAQTAESAAKKASSAVTGGGAQRR